MMLSAPHSSQLLSQEVLHLRKVESKVTLDVNTTQITGYLVLGQLSVGTRQAHRNLCLTSRCGTTSVLGIKHSAVTESHNLFHSSCCNPCITALYVEVHCRCTCKKTSLLYIGIFNFKTNLKLLLYFTSRSSALFYWKCNNSPKFKCLILDTQDACVSRVKTRG